jgi:hypothetical protein
LARKIRERLIGHGILHRVPETRAETASAHPGYVCRLGRKRVWRFETNRTIFEEMPPVTASPGRSHQTSAKIS